MGVDDVRLRGCDLPLGAAPDQYRAVVEQMRQHPHAVGALITTHKIDLFEACRDLFDSVDAYAELCGEASCLVVRNGAVAASATDPISSARALDDFFQPTGGADVLCLGGGGSATAITVHFVQRGFAGRITVVDKSPDRLARLRAIHRRLDPASDVRLIEAANADDLVTELPPGSLVINATGMGKDLPGSPISDAAVFPSGGYAWDLNYRGELEFLRLARAQPIHVEDGWRYFIHGWGVIMGRVLGVEVDAEKTARLAAIAESAR
jgi:shikimate 5-dehydrogenase